jgi:hypothetical protein
LALLKKNSIHIIYSRLLLIVFIAGQVILYGHQHNTFASHAKAHSSSQQTISENCQLCDAMHFNHSVIDQQVHVAVVLSATRVYDHFDYDFISLKIVRSAGRSPPIS